MRKTADEGGQPNRGGVDALSFRAELWLYAGPGGWHFLTLPEAISARLRHEMASSASAWGSLKVAARIGATTWTTSLFPDAKRGAYLLPVKADVRKREGLRSGAEVDVVLLLGGGDQTP